MNYWRANLLILSILLSIWFLVSFGFGIIWSEKLDAIMIGGFKLGFWFAQQGSIYVFVILTILGFLTFPKFNQSKSLMIYLVSLSIILEIFHLAIPERSFQWSDLFGNVIGVIVVIFIQKFISEYGFFKK